MLGNEELVIDLKDGTARCEKIKVNEYKLSEKDLDSIVSVLAERIKYYAGLQKKLAEEKILFSTGGLDSRLNLAGDLSAGIRPVLANWQGSGYVMNTKPEDREISLKLSELENLKLEEIDVSSNDNLELIDKENFDKYGEAACIYGGNTGWQGFFNNSEYVFFDFGYFGELLKSLEPLDEKYKKLMSVEDYSQMYIGRNSHIYTPKFGGYRSLYKICKQ